MYTLEACVDSLESAMAAKRGGATRLELCANLIIGGTTPSVPLLQRVRGETGLPVNVLLRPRFGDFLYTGEEFSIMLQEAQSLLENGADAIVSGCLTREGDIDIPRTKALVDLAHSRCKRFTLHRAFDLCRQPFEALAVCKELGVDTILTSGQENTCIEGLSLLMELMEQRGKVEILVGAGVNAAGIRQIREACREFTSFHMSGKITVESAMMYRKPGVSMGLPSMSEYEKYYTDEKKIREAWKEITRI